MTFSCVPSMARQRTCRVAVHICLAICHTRGLIFTPSSINKMGPSTSKSGTHRVPDGKQVLPLSFFNPWHLVSTIKIQRKASPITPPIKTGAIEEVIQHSSKTVASNTPSLLNNTNLTFRLLPQTLTLAYQFLNVTQPGSFGDCLLCVFHTAG